MTAETAFELAFLVWSAWWSGPFLGAMFAGMAELVHLVR